ncbi:hypothetical protein [Methylobacterium sp. NEAU K]|uniref:hypothetical protein n=1 Tax=Methylobacterium sp. NEAU K TaxID=3064946 RepID=UPI0027337058|nr:hypothetical protein [Methylobacterium sp. NEAU K]MDP4006922.1 hypothetical protein [Methylobacterium sp. NEAU K]
MSASASHRDNLADLLSDMEEKVCNLVRWGEAISALGTINSMVHPGSIYVMGRGLLAEARTVKEDWERCFHLSHLSEEDAR